jgi:hypothetical protein
LHPSRRGEDAAPQDKVGNLGQMKTLMVRRRACAVSNYVGPKCAEIAEVWVLRGYLYQSSLRKQGPIRRDGND